MLDRFIFKILLLVLFLGVSMEKANALPWDVDLFRQQSIKSGEMPRAPAEGTVARGFKPFTMTVEEASEKLKNPINPSFDSLWKGRRIWNSNCSVCHGDDGKSQTLVGPQVAAPNLTEQFYKNSTDGKVYGVLRLGGANMPRYGYKLTEDEHWHVINYLRFLQGEVVEPKFPLPEKK